MGLSFLVRKPDSGLGNIRSSPADPSRNVDWVLLATQALLTIIGCFVVYSASWTRIAGDPYAFVTRQVVFAIAATVVMVVVMSVDYEWFKERAILLYGATLALLVLLLLMGIASRQSRISFDLGPFNVQPAELAKFTTLIALAAYLAEDCPVGHARGGCPYRKLRGIRRERADVDRFFRAVNTDDHRYSDNSIYKLLEEHPAYTLRKGMIREL